MVLCMLNISTDGTTNTVDDIGTYRVILSVDDKERWDLDILPDGIRQVPELQGLQPVAHNGVCTWKVQLGM